MGAKFPNFRPPWATGIPGKTSPAPPPAKNHNVNPDPPKGSRPSPPPPPPPPLRSDVEKIAVMPSDVFTYPVHKVDQLDELVDVLKSIKESLDRFEARHAAADAKGGFFRRLRRTTWRR